MTTSNVSLNLKLPIFVVTVRSWTVSWGGQVSQSTAAKPDAHKAAAEI